MSSYDWNLLSEELEDEEQEEKEEPLPLQERNRLALKDFILWRREKAHKKQAIKFGDLHKRK